jgi:hypothetical protein
VTPDTPAPNATAGDSRRKAALCVERSLEHYAEGRYADAIQELEAALTAQPGHARSVEFLTWVKEIASGRRILTSAAFAAVADEAPSAAEAEGASAGKKTGTLLGLPALERELGTPSLAAVEAKIQEHVEQAAAVAATAAAVAASQVDETPESVTREWSTALANSNTPVLDGAELSDEQIASLLDADAGRGLTLSKHTALPGVTARSSPPAEQVEAEHPPVAEDGDDEDEHESTDVRFASQVVELIADAEDEEAPPSMEIHAPASESDPFLTPLAADEDAARVSSDQTSDDPGSMPTNPFVNQRLREIAPALMATAAAVDELLAVTATGWSLVKTAVDNGAAREAFDAVERIVESVGGVERVMVEHEQLATRAYELYLGDMQGIPRFGKTTPELDSRSAFLLSRIDGSTCADDLLDVSGMPRLEALRVLARLVAGGVVVLRK